mmetsp:Transcript_66685/g.217047  ORF Transcript_66685/g.217047 Transcript_66685/m.217047 type:complete len:278 (+) Transcript_66685:525-1358(+)
MSEPKGSERSHSQISSDMPSGLVTMQRNSWPSVALTHGVRVTKTVDTGKPVTKMCFSGMLSVGSPTPTTKACSAFSSRAFFLSLSSRSAGTPRVFHNTWIMGLSGFASGSFGGLSPASLLPILRLPALGYTRNTSKATQSSEQVWLGGTFRIEGKSWILSMPFLAQSTPLNTPKVGAKMRTCTPSCAALPKHCWSKSYGMNPQPSLMGSPSSDIGSACNISKLSARRLRKFCLFVVLSMSSKREATLRMLGNAEKSATFSSSRATSMLSSPGPDVAT